MYDDQKCQEDEKCGGKGEAEYSDFDFDEVVGLQIHINHDSDDIEDREVSSLLTLLSGRSGWRNFTEAEKSLLDGRQKASPRSDLFVRRPVLVLCCESRCLSGMKKKENGGQRTSRANREIHRFLHPPLEILLPTFRFLSPFHCTSPSKDITIAKERSYHLTASHRCLCLISQDYALPPCVRTIDITITIDSSTTPIDLFFALASREELVDLFLFPSHEPFLLRDPCLLLLLLLTLHHPLLVLLLLV